MRMAVPAELLNTNVRRGPFRAAIFDFDGTLSLFREGWPRVMIGMMVEELRTKGLASEEDVELWRIVERFVMELNGHPSLVQMARFVAEMESRGGEPAPATAYLQEYLERLLRLVRQRWHVVETRIATPAAWVVPNAHAILRNLQARGLPLFIASGTDYESVHYEARLLELAPFFGGEIHAPHDNDPTFTKAQTIATVLQRLGIRGEELVGFGDGVVETLAVKAVGGVAVGVASAEPGQTGIHPDKRARLTAAGADLIIPDYVNEKALVSWLWGEVEEVASRA